MSFFKPNYNKPGRGVEKDEAPGPGYIRFWKLFFRNFNKMLMYGVVYFFIILPLICFVFYFITVRINPELVASYIDAVENAANSELVAEGEAVVYNSWSWVLYSVIFYIPTYISIPLVVMSAIAFGPINCGLVYCMRNHSREEHVWFSDMFVRAWRNVKQGLFFGFLDIAVVMSMLIYVYSTDSLGLPEWLFTYLKILALGIFVLYMVMRWYIYQMIVTFNLKITGLLKNAWMFVILGLGRNLIAGLLSIIFIVFCLLFPLYYPSAMPFFLLLMMALFWSILIFLTTFTTYPVMHKYLVAPALAEKNKKEAKARRAEALKRKEAGEEYDIDDLGEEKEEQEEKNDKESKDEN